MLSTVKWALSTLDYVDSGKEVHTDRISQTSQAAFPYAQVSEGLRRADHLPLTTCLQERPNPRLKDHALTLRDMGQDQESETVICVQGMPWHCATGQKTRLSVRENHPENTLGPRIQSWDLRIRERLPTCVTQRQDGGQREEGVGLSQEG